MRQELNELLPLLQRLHREVTDVVLRRTEEVSTAELAAVARDNEGDTIYRIDSVSEEFLLAFFERHIAPRFPLVLIAEGIEGGEVVLPRGTPATTARWRIVVDPIDGTRGLMYQKRSAWILTGVAPNHGRKTCLSDIELALQSEIPLVKQHLFDSVWACKGEGAHAERTNRWSGERWELKLKPSSARTIAHGFAMISRFFPGARDELAAIDEEIIHGALGPVARGKAHCFEDQYISTGGQLYELMCGHDRFVADLRPLLERVLARKGLALGICCHPYDLCTELIARELGVCVVSVRGEALEARLAVDPEVAWAGYANEDVRRQIAPLLESALAKRGLL